jgi:hypothetical protein
MKSKNILVTAIVVAIALISCKKTNTDCGIIPAKIIRYDCDRVIFQLQSATLIGDSIWTDVQTGQQYTNVVSYYNTCKIAELTKGELKTIYVKTDISNQTPNISCFQCEALSQNPPQTKIGFADISLAACENLQN